MREEIVVEVEQIQRNNPEGVLIADEVVDYARDPSTALHNQFEWDDTKAAIQHRLDQARRVIRVVVEFQIVNNREVVVPTYRSLGSDRMKPRGGYRRIKDILSVEETRAELLDMALQELARVQDKYALLTELAAVFAAADEVRTKAAKKKAKKGGAKSKKKKKTTKKSAKKTRSSKSQARV